MNYRIEREREVKKESEKNKLTTNKMSQQHQKDDHECQCKSTTAAQSLNEMDFERGIWSAALYNDIEKLNRFIRQGQQNDIDSNGYTALHYAARNGHYEICQSLVHSNVDVNALTRSGGTTALIRAAMMGHKNIVELLLKHRARSDIQDQDGNNALHKAAQNGHGPVIETILRDNASLKQALNNKGQTPYDLASLKLPEHITALLLNST